MTVIYIQVEHKYELMYQYDDFRKITRISLEAL